MRKKIGKRIGPVPIALVAVFALAAFAAIGLLATTGVQPAEAQSSTDCSVFAAEKTIDDEAVGANASHPDPCAVPGTEANIKFEGVLPSPQAGSITFFVYGVDVGEGDEAVAYYPPDTRYFASGATPPVMVSCGLLEENGSTPQTDDQGAAIEAMVPHQSYVDNDCKQVDSLRSKIIQVEAPGNNANSETLTIEGDELSQATLYVYRVRPVIADIRDAPDLDDEQLPDPTVMVNIRFLGPPSSAKECGMPAAACSTLTSNGGDPVDSGDTTANVVLTVRDENSDMLSGFAQLSLMDAGSALFTETNRTTQTVRVASGVTEAIEVKGLPTSAAFKYGVMADFETSNGTLTVMTSIKRFGDAETIDANAYLCTPGGKLDIEEVLEVVDEDDVVTTEAKAPNECVSELNALKNSNAIDDPNPVTSVAPGSVITIYGKATDSAGNKVSSLEWSPADEDAEAIFNPAAGAAAETRIQVSLGDVAGSYEIKVNDVRDDAEITLTIVVADDTSQISLTGPEMISAATGLATFTVTATDEVGNVPSDAGELNGKYTVAVRNKDARVLGVDGNGFVIFNKKGVGTFQVLMPEDAEEGISLSITVGYQDITATVVVMYGEMMVEPEPMPMLLGDPSITSAMSDAAGMATIMLMPGDNADQHWIWALPTDLVSEGMYSDRVAGDATSFTMSGLTSGMSYWFTAVAGRDMEDGTQEWSMFSDWSAGTLIE